jgi:hypothetical protein
MDTLLPLGRVANPPPKEPQYDEPAYLKEVILVTWNVTNSVTIQP